MYEVRKTRLNNHYLVVTAAGFPASDYMTEAEAIALALTLNGVRF